MQRRVPEPGPERLARIDELRRKLSEDPEDVELRTDLLMELCHPAFHGERERIDLLLWHVKHRPEARLMCSPCACVDHERFPELHAEVELAWQTRLQIDAQQPAIARAAACFLFGADPDRARKLLGDALAVHPTDASLWIDFGRAADTPAERLRCFQQARSLGSTQPNLLRWLCDAAVGADDLVLAAQYGNELVAESKAAPPTAQDNRFGTRDARAFVGDLIKPRGQRAYARHHGHTTLGRVALRRGDTQAALEHLRASAEVDTDSRLSSYGPSFELARELCERGYPGEVREYLTACMSFWDREVLEQWCAELSEGRVPDFD